MNRRKILAGLSTLPFLNFVKADDTEIDYFKFMSETTLTDALNMGWCNKKDDIKEKLLNNQRRNSLSAMYHYQSDPAKFKEVEKLLNSNDFNAILDTDWISVQPMLGPVSIAIAIAIGEEEEEGETYKYLSTEELMKFYNISIGKNGIATKTAVEAGSRFIPDYRKTFDVVYKEMEIRRENSDSKHVTYCPYIMITHDNSHRYGVVDSWHKNSFPVLNS